jgi:uncharacterized membrane protein
MNDLNPPTGFSRIQSIDILRGIIMVIMALDHVRDYFSQTPYGTLDLSQTSPLLFFTRWITHFCAPNFIFLSGISIFLYEQKVKSKKQVSIFLFTRGFWLIAVEMIIMSYVIVWDRSLLLFLVIWAIGISMVLLSALTWLPKKALLVLSLLIIVFHQLIPDAEQVGAGNIFMSMLHHRPFMLPATPPIIVAYSILPWLGVMMLGYCIGHWFLKSPDQQARTLLIAGSSAVALFFLLRFINVYGDQVPWAAQERGTLFTILSFFNVSKSPPSLLFLLITIGPAMLLLSRMTNVKGFSFFKAYGAVPFFYYVMHFLLIATAAWTWTRIQFGKPVNLAMASPKDFPSDYNPTLLRAYGVWILLVLALYFPCRWFGEYRKKHPEKRWLSYL